MKKGDDKSGKQKQFPTSAIRVLPEKDRESSKGKRD